MKKLNLRKTPKNTAASMTIMEHLIEARRRIIYSLLGIAIMSAGGWFLSEPALNLIAAPLQIDSANPLAKLTFTTVGAAFDLRIRLAIALGIVGACPWWLYQIWAFISPGLYRNERRNILGFFFAAVLLFTLGAAMGVWTAPRAVRILNSFTPHSAESLFTADAYVLFTIELVLVFGLSFLAPELMVMISYVGLVTWKSWLKAWRWAVMVAFTFAAIANPLPGPWSMIIQALVLVVLYFGAIGICFLIAFSRRKKEADSEKETP